MQKPIREICLTRLKKGHVLSIILNTLLCSFLLVISCTSEVNDEDSKGYSIKDIQPSLNSISENQRDLFGKYLGMNDNDDFTWPRVIQTEDGAVTISNAPKRVFSLSLGHAEIIAALLGAGTLVAVADFFADPNTSASWAEFDDLPKAGSDPEEITSLSPDLVIVSSFTSADKTQILQDMGLNVLRARLDPSAQGNITNVLFMGYVMGAEQQAAELALVIERRLEFIESNLPSQNAIKPLALALSRFSDIYVAGNGSIEGGIIEAAGAVNVAAKAGIQGHQTVSIESIVAMNPEIILITQEKESAEILSEDLFSHPALTNVPAIRNKRIFFADPTYYTTLSHWNIRGIEESAKIFFPVNFKEITFFDFPSAKN